MSTLRKDMIQAALNTAFMDGSIDVALAVDVLQKGGSPLKIAARKVVREIEDYGIPLKRTRRKDGTHYSVDWEG